MRIACKVSILILVWSGPPAAVLVDVSVHRPHYVERNYRHHALRTHRTGIRSAVIGRSHKRIHIIHRLPGTSIHHNLVRKYPPAYILVRTCLIADVTGTGFTFPAVVSETNGRVFGHYILQMRQFGKLHSVKRSGNNDFGRQKDFRSCHLHEIGTDGTNLFLPFQVNGHIQTVTRDKTLPGTVGISPAPTDAIGQRLISLSLVMPVVGSVILHRFAQCQMFDGMCRFGTVADFILQRERMIAFGRQPIHFTQGTAVKLAV